MPNKTIYVSDDDLRVYSRAQELAGGNLSSAISTALRRYVEIEEGRLEGYEEITVTVGPGRGHKVRFSGALIGEWGNSTWSKVEVYHVYRTRKGKFAVHVERTPEYTARDEKGNSGGWRSWLGIGNFSWGLTPGESTLEVVDSVEALREKVPPQLFDMVAAAAMQPAVEDLDI